MRHPMMSVLEQNPVLPAVKVPDGWRRVWPNRREWCSCCAGTF